MCVEVIVCYIIVVFLRHGVEHLGENWNSEKKLVDQLTMMKSSRWRQFFSADCRRDVTVTASVVGDGQDRRRHQTWPAADTVLRPVAVLSAVFALHDRQTRWPSTQTSTADCTSQAPSTPNQLPVPPATNAAIHWRCMSFVFQPQDRRSTADNVWAALSTRRPNLSNSQLLREQ